MYDHPNYTTRREIQATNIAGAASASVAKFLQFQATVLKKVHVLVQTAGTNASAGFDIYVGTSSVGAVTIGTSTAGSVLHSGAINASVPQNGVIELKGKADSATAVIAVSIEHQLDPDNASQS